MIKSIALALAIAAALAVAGCGGSSNDNGSGEGGAYGGGGGGSTASKEASSEPAGAPAVVEVANVPDAGKVLVDSKGFTLYYFEKDKGGKSACYGACANVWPPLTGTPEGKGGTVASEFGTTKRSDGTVQVTYAGWPLYTYAADTEPGEDKGTDLKSFGATWYPLHPNGEKAGE
jgi:predicted lipoprotein with Yx(FWY)xxD motif